MSVKITVDTEQVRELWARLKAVVSGPRRFAALNDIKNRLLNMAVDAFQKQASPEGEPWPRLSVGYALHKARLGKGSQGILRFTGALFRSLPLHSGVIEDRLVFVGTGNLPYAAAHQFGAQFPAMEVVAKKAKALHFFAGGEPVFAKRARIPARTLPARPYLPSEATAERVAVETLEEHLEAAVGEKS